MPVKKTEFLNLPKGTKVPNHIAVVLDGNRRWARARGLKTLEGHKAGFEAAKRTARASREFGVHTFTVWGFSTENWDRSPLEIRYLMGLFRRFVKEAAEEAKETDTRIIHLGRKDRLPKDLINLIAKTEDDTKHNKAHVLNVALDYGGRNEITRAVQKIVSEGIPSKKITEDLISSYLDTGNQPYPFPDLFIRPSGEQRTSGLLPWQMVYSEYYWEPEHLPDMDAHKLMVAICDYSRRRRRFGGNDKEDHFKFKPEMAAKLEINWWRLRKIPEGTKFRDYAINHIKEQWGLSKSLAGTAAKHLVEAIALGERSNWRKAKSNLIEFYRLIRDEVKLAFEPSIAASLELKLMQKSEEGEEALTRELVSEVYRISEFQARKAAHLRTLATSERTLAEGGLGEHHWDLAEEYLEMYYRALKERIA